jgi:Domain of unknown function (DUF6285)
MAQDRPTTAELAQAVREFLERDVMTATEGRVQFHTRVAINALGMIERELASGALFSEGERARAVALLGAGDPGADGDVRVLERALAARIRDGSLDDRLDAVRAHVRATVREKLLVANPGYLPADPPA